LLSPLLSNQPDALPGKETLNLHLLVRLIRTGYTGLGFWNNVAVMMIVSLVTAAAHLIQIALWVVDVLLTG